MCRQVGLRQTFRCPQRGRRVTGARSCSTPHLLSTWTPRRLVRSVTGTGPVFTCSGHRVKLHSPPGLSKTLSAHSSPRAVLPLPSEPHRASCSSGPGPPGGWTVCPQRDPRSHPLPGSGRRAPACLRPGRLGVHPHGLVFPSPVLFRNRTWPPPWSPPERAAMTGFTTLGFPSSAFPTGATA